MLITTTAILQALLDGEKYGLEIVERVRKATGGKQILLQGSMYPALRSLEAEGFIEGRWSEPLAERGGRPRRYYTLTAEGRRVAREEAVAIAALLKPALGSP